MSHPLYSEITSRKRDVHFGEAPLNLVLSGIGRKHAAGWDGSDPGAETVLSTLSGQSRPAANRRPACSQLKGWRSVLVPEKISTTS